MIDCWQPANERKSVKHIMVITYRFELQRKSKNTVKLVYEVIFLFGAAIIAVGLALTEYDTFGLFGKEAFGSEKSEYGEIMKTQRQHC